MNSAPAPAVKARLPRLRRWYAKFFYIVIGVAIYYFGGALAFSDNSRGILRSVLVVLLILLAARLFRGSTEPGDEPRPWWRMTGAPLAGFVLGTLIGLVAIALFLYAIGLETSPLVRRFRSQEAYVVVSFILFAGVAVLYLTSSLRLRSLDRVARTAARASED